MTAIIAFLKNALTVVNTIFIRALPVTGVIIQPYINSQKKWRKFN